MQVFKWKKRLLAAVPIGVCFLVSSVSVIAQFDAGCIVGQASNSRRAARMGYQALRAAGKGKGERL
jgi:hypothetical protein